MEEEIKETETIEEIEIEEIQNTFNEDPMKVLIEDGEAENVLQD